MRSRTSFGLLLLVPWAALCAAERTWTPLDSIAVRYFATDQMSTPTLLNDDSGQPIVVAPDGRHFFFIMRHGELACDCVEYELQVFATAVLDRPAGSIKMRSASSSAEHAGINDARWIDNRTIQFVGFEGEGPRAGYHYDVIRGRLLRITAPDHWLSGFFHTRAGSNIYLARGDSHPPASPAYPMARPSAGTLAGIVTGNTRRGFDGQLFASHKGGPFRLIGSTSLPLAEAWISPDGEHAVVQFEPQGSVVPARWSRYDRALTHGFRFMLAELGTGAVRPLLDAPIGAATKAGYSVPPSTLWFPDSQRVVVINTALPLDTNVEIRRATPYIIDYEVKTGRWREVAPFALPPGERGWYFEVDWVRPGKEFAIRYNAVLGDPARIETHTLNQGRWVKREAPAGFIFPTRPTVALANDLTVKMVESANEPPHIVAATPSDEVTLTTPDPALIGVARARVMPVQWQDPDGKIETGGLMLPPGTNQASRLPLAIHAYYYTPQFFRPDGPAPTGYAAQSVASRGMAVLFINAPHVDRVAELGETPREFPYFAARIDAAVEALAAKDIIDPSRVGVVGFSRAGTQTYYAITHPGRVRLAAAVIADAATASYVEYIDNAALSASSQVEPELASQYGGGPFWAHREKWLSEMPAFNVHRVETSTMFQHGNASNVLFMFETLAAFKINRKPFEFLVVPDGEHQLIRPRERIASMAATADWLAFWLKGEQRTEPYPGTHETRAGLAEQYVRWEKLRERQ